MLVKMCKLDLARDAVRVQSAGRGDINEEGGTLGFRRDAAPRNTRKIK